jgi:tRNA-dihydrouridine synthase
VPVTVKMRLGWDEDALNAPALARRAEQAGVKMVTVHGRTRCQFYNGKADWAAIRRVREAVSIPLVANGDVASAEDAATILEQSGADAVMVGRAHYGAPWAAGAIATVAAGALSYGSAPPPLSPPHKGEGDSASTLQCANADDFGQNSDAGVSLPLVGRGQGWGCSLADYVVSHYEDMLELYGIESGLRQARKHLGWYLDRHAPDIGPDLRKAVMTGLEPKQVIAGLRAAFDSEAQPRIDLRSAA